MKKWLYLILSLLFCIGSAVLLVAHWGANDMVYYRSLPNFPISERLLLGLGVLLFLASTINSVRELSE